MKNLCWLDLETTGLEPGRCQILEIGIVITDRDLKLLVEGSWLIDATAVVVAPESSVWDRIAYEMHETSGLLQALRTQKRLPLHWVTGAAVDFITEHGAEKSPLCGNSVHFDRAFLAAARECKPILDALHYRNLDVSSLRIASDLWGKPLAPKNPPAHRALNDLYASIAEFIHYRETMQ